MQVKELAQEAYESYAKYLGTSREPALAEWHSLPDSIRNAWVVSTCRVLEQALLAYDLSYYVDPAA